MSNIREDRRCAYSRFDPHSLQPSSRETLRRLVDLRLPTEWLRGRSVLDIGCNSGLVSVFAAQQGASTVDAVDVQAQFPPAVAELAERHRLPISARVANFFDLAAERRKYDVVFCLEVIHWLLDQRKIPVGEVVQGLLGLVGERLVIETPWATTEPSIRALTSLTHEGYSVDALFSELLKWFDAVQIVNFPNYFDDQSGSRRVLMVASGPRPMQEALTRVPNYRGGLTPVGSSRDSVHFVDDGEAGLALKRLPAHSPLGRVEVDLAGDVLSRLRSVELLSRPTAFSDGKFVFSDGANRYFLSRWIGMPPQSIRPVLPRLDTATIADALVSASAAIQESLAPLVPALRENRFFFAHDVKGSVEKAADLLLAHGRSEVSGFVREFCRRYQSAPEAALEAGAHGDLHTRNFCVGVDGRPSFIDLENTQLASVYFDVVWGSLLFGLAAAEIVEAAQDLGRRLHVRPFDDRDAAFLAVNYASWIAANLAGAAGGKVERGQLDHIARIGECLTGVCRALTAES